MNITYFKYSDFDDNAKLTIIITLKTVEHYDMLERLSYRTLIEESVKEKIEFLVVDFGSKNNLQVREKCKALKFNYIFVNTTIDGFNAGLARNIGAQYATGEFICHEDIDLSPPDHLYYSKLLDQIIINKLDIDNKKFISVPVLYLTANGTSEFFNTPEQLRNEIFLNYLLLNNKEKFTFFMPASSVILINRHYYLSLGGYNESFNGWGLEDLEYAYRITRLANQFHTPADFKKLNTNIEFHKQAKYQGWRVQFRLHGELLSKSGICLFHIDHPIDRSWRNKKRHSNNLKLFQDSVDNFEKSIKPSPLGDPQKSTLIFGKGCFVYNDVMRPLWGDIHIRGYEYFDNKDIVKYINENNIDQVVFTNPYANEKRLNTYNIIKKNNIPYYVVERGALNDSLFIDPTGFCCESTMYKEIYWDKEISKEDYKKTIDYISNEKNECLALEKQGARKDLNKILEELEIPKNTKILFVPLQSRSDTTVNYFAEDIGSYDNFLKLVQDLADNLPLNWEIVVKHHPLSNTQESLKNVKFVDKYHIKDLLELSDFVLLINSGVGVLSTIWNKPVIYTGKAFYASDKLNRKATNFNQVLDILDSGFKPSESDCIKFMSYLINDFYSFGKMKTHFAEYKDRDNLTITDEIDIYELRMDNKLIYRNDINSKKVDFNSCIYDIYREDIGNNILGKKPLPRVVHNKATPKIASNDRLMIYKRKFNKLRYNPKLFFIDAINKRLS